MADTVEMDTAVDPAQPKDIRVQVTAVPREQFPGYGSNIGRYFLNGQTETLMVSQRQLDVLNGEPFLKVVNLDEAVATAKSEQTKADARADAKAADKPKK